MKNFCTKDQKNLKFLLTLIIIKIKMWQIKFICIMKVILGDKLTSMSFHILEKKKWTNNSRNCTVNTRSILANKRQKIIKAGIESINYKAKNYLRTSLSGLPWKLLKFSNNYFLQLLTQSFVQYQEESLIQIWRCRLYLHLVSEFLVGSVLSMPGKRV